MKNYSVYWYKLPEHDNLYVQGYIGITNNMKRRNLEHRRNKSVTHFTNALKLYDIVEYEVLHTELTIEEASDLEYAYRPSTNIGWNSAIGGSDSLGVTLSVPITLYHESDHNKLYNFNSITEAADTIKVSRARLAQAKSRGKQHYGYDGWAIVINPTIDRSTTLNIAQIASSRLLGIKRNKPSHFKGVTTRWTDEQKQAISQTHKGKTISEEHKQALRNKNRISPSLCKQVTLKHKDSDTEYTFHSISEASRQLELPLSRLKSKAQRPLNQYGLDGWAITSLGSE